MTRQACLQLLLSTDAYKLEHYRMYPPHTRTVYSNLTARGSRIPTIDHTVFFGLQAFLTEFNKKWEQFFALDDTECAHVLSDYRTRVSSLLQIPEEHVSVDHFHALHALGYLPLIIRALPEGSIVPLRVPYLTMENTHPDFYWLTNYCETVLSAELWQLITSATVAWHNRKLLHSQAVMSGDEKQVVVQGHDFSCRGMAGMQAATASSAGHLLSFQGSDTISAVMYVDTYYPGDNGIIATSCPATEHSIMCAAGEQGELETFGRLLHTYPTGVLSIVSDTWNIWRVITEYLPQLRDVICSRQGKLVIRPDSGDPEKILCGNPDATPGSPENKGVVTLLAEIFGTQVNSKGFKELEEHIGVVYGDSIYYDRALSITNNLINQGYSSTCVTFGFGSYTYQYQTRDTFGMAVKATWVDIDGQGIDILKNPITDNGTKKSATGRLAVQCTADGELTLIEHATPEQEENQCMRTVFEDGSMLVCDSFRTIRERLWGTW